MNQKKEKHGFLNLIINILIPTVVLMKLSGENHLGPVYGLIVALAFPLFYGLFEFFVQKKYNFVSIIGFVSILFTGGIALLHLDAQWIAVKEASVPLLIGIVLWIMEKTQKYRLVHILIDKMVDLQKIYKEADRYHSRGILDRAYHRTTQLITAAFFLSAILNYALAKILVHSPSGTTEFNNELGQMTMWSFLVISLPVTLLLMVAVFYYFKHVRRATRMSVKEFFRTP